MSCRHPCPKLCELLGMHITGRLWSIWSGKRYRENEPALPNRNKLQKYREEWCRQAGFNFRDLKNLCSATEHPEPPIPTPKSVPKLCRHLGRLHRKVKPPGGGCSCRAYSVYLCRQWGECTLNIRDKSIPACSTCKQFEPKK